MPSITPTLDVRALEHEAAELLAAARRQSGALHLPGARERHRAQLERVIELARGALAAADQGGEPSAPTEPARATLVQALAARAHDARHGAGQLSQSAQRAPTLQACDDGWRRVEAIAAGAEASAREAARLVVDLDDPVASRAARDAEVAAWEARQVVEERNHAYTFHADPGFSFGEGWYLAAAAVLAGVAIQIEPDERQTAQAERFLQDAGLAAQIQAYRPRPRANKHLPELVAQAFRADPVGAQRRLRAAFLGDEPVAAPIAEWCDSELGGSSAGTKVLLWLRYGAHQPGRNTAYAELVELACRVVDAGLVPVLIGDALRDGTPPPGALDLTLFWKRPLFQGPDMRRAQLQLFERLRERHGLVGQVGVTTAGMDGPALMGLPTMYLTTAPNPRLGTWVGTVPGYEEIVRGDGFLARIDRTLRRWAAAAPVGPPAPGWRA